MRSVPEWIGKTCDAAIPPRVRLRVFEKYKSRCYLTGWRITASDYWDLDHIIPLVNGGEHRESNLAPALRIAHREKTSRDAPIIAKSRRVRKRNAGIRKPPSMPGSKNTPWKKTFYHGTVRRTP